MGFYYSALPGSEIPESMAFKIAFVIVTVAYVTAMIILFILYKNSVKKIPKPKDDNINKTDNKDKNIKNITNK